MSPIPKSLCFRIPSRSITTIAPHTGRCLENARTGGCAVCGRSVKTISADGVIQIADSVTVFIASQTVMCLRRVYSASDRSGIWTLNTKNNRTPSYTANARRRSSATTCSTTDCRTPGQDIKSCVDYTKAPIRQLRHWRCLHMRTR